MKTVSVAILELLVCDTDGLWLYRPADIPSLPPAVLPTYGLGDSYQFSDGSNASVAAVDGDVVRWRDNDSTFVTSRDVLAPRLTWADSAALGERQIAATRRCFSRWHPRIASSLPQRALSIRAWAANRSQCGRIGTAASSGLHG